MTYNISFSRKKNILFPPKVVWLEMGAEILNIMLNIYINTYLHERFNFGP